MEFEGSVSCSQQSPLDSIVCHLNTSRTVTHHAFQISFKITPQLRLGLPIQLFPSVSLISIVYESIISLIVPYIYSISYPVAYIQFGDSVNQSRCRRIKNSFYSSIHSILTVIWPGDLFTSLSCFHVGGACYGR